MKLSITDHVHLVEPGDFEPSEHWYPRVLNSNIHPLVSHFLHLTTEQYIERYCRLNPQANPGALKEILNYQPRYFKWSGTDMMHITNNIGAKKLTVIETNSCPSGQKSMPLLDLNVEQGGYKRLIEDTFLPQVEKHDEEGALAVIYDKNPMENVGYASTLADAFGEDVYLAKFDKNDPDPPAKFEDKKLYIRSENDQWIPIRAAFRYVTQEPWNRIPVGSKTLLLNPIEACLAGGRNKSEAFLAYSDFNEKFKADGIGINTPETFLDVELNDIPEYFEALGKSMVIKVPDSNAGQGVYTITSEKELEQAMKALKQNPPEDKYLIQQLIYSNYIDGADKEKAWYHVGTIPDKKNRSYAFDLRLMMHYTSSGIRPLAIYSRRAKLPLNQPMPEGADSWDLYGTNLSVKQTEGWSYDDERLMLYDIRNFANLGLGIDELISGFIQSAMATYAIDQHAIKKFDHVNYEFESINS
ncbi:hypothetical protein [Sinomicrobium weinanense]|uniref:ATP-grasp domain-containing protein n=1 Tax=Sinomicrobium weinanense TaxID=2842200 RepID=A0A926JNQ3_9FLAO|nr:hypothetical protein [Sinomicrobium weinanense]MBC9794657.1 hypothetical protein [Sinomicrobium weinanense]MBU3124142.1 hypothetical protein [Sinomicrobium weinanense]